MQTQRKTATKRAVRAGVSAIRSSTRTSMRRSTNAVRTAAADEIEPKRSAVHKAVVEKAGTRVSGKNNKERVRLELMKLEINRNANKSWDPYLIFAFEHPEKPNQTVISTWPERPIELRKSSDNVVNFAGGGRGADGATVYSIDMPSDRHIGMQVFVFQDKGKTRKSGAIMEEVTGLIGKGASSLGPAATANPYVAAALVVNKGLNVVGDLLSKVRDKNRGYANLDEKFGLEFEKRSKLRRVKKTSTGDFILTYRWIIEPAG